MPNHLVGESSPYLLQHAGNPVEWYPWGPEAFRRARDEDRPVFLSIGYSACHWCHVMERESFTDPDTAALLNQHFVSVKVDREERPDLDAIYMQAVTSLTGRGGWPLSVWLTPDGAPFYGGTYFPPHPRYGMSSFGQVLGALAKAWSTQRSDLLQAASRLVEYLGQETTDMPTTIPKEQLLTGAMQTLQHSFDRANGGWGQAPKFPMPLLLEFMLAERSTSPDGQLHTEIEGSLDAMAAGGIYDQIGGGFHRYSTDEAWQVPHFEKMLYDNAQLARCYLHAWQLFRKTRYREVVEETLDYLLRDLSHDRGGFFSAEDADSEGREGAFFVWTPEQIRAALTTDEAELVERVYGVTAKGNFEGANVLHLAAGPQALGADLAAARAKLLRARSNRVRPARDDKILAGWNGLALAAYAEAARALGSERYLGAAIKTGEFIAEELLQNGDRLAHSWKDGRRPGNGFLEDYSFVAEGLLALYQTTGAERWFATARALTDAVIEHFRRPEGGFYDTSNDHEELIIRPRSMQDSPVPSGNSMMATVLLKMAAFTGGGRYWDLAEETLVSAAGIVEQAPGMCGQWLLATFLANTRLTEVAVVGNPGHPRTNELLAVVQAAYRPTVVLATGPARPTQSVPMLQGRLPDQGSQAAAWVCRQSTCAPPTSDPAQLRTMLDGAL